ncbi:macro domain-like protein [Trematosphaeria pertusa]|uniref:Macro domain-like protein n=1 Tax=Trematosphaeria pertusa TaxID=390896 RepID=A0A6A6IZ35_9PLEO|nr:macro domain-like protein [Trematosphaeria pertusa]KAF2254443.1 macro domain-like protein [Trematosphaeria pertusa]
MFPASVLERALRALLNESPAIKTRRLQSYLGELESLEQLQLLRQLLCVRSPRPPLSRDVLEDIDAVLLQERKHRILTPGASIRPISTLDRQGRPSVNIKLWKGDITTLASDVTAITNAANSQMLGCFQPSHKCIDNVIHSWAGPRLRQECFDIMSATKGELPVGDAVVTRGYCLPAPFVIHTVGPQLQRGDAPTEDERQQLRQCYISVLEEADSLPASSDGAKRVAICGISTGLFAFPTTVAAGIAVGTVYAWLAHHEDSSITDVIFVTYTDEDHDIYSSLLETPKPGWHSVASPANSQPRFQCDTLLIARRWLQEADAIILSAGAGLSAADGLDYTSPTLFRTHFPTFRQYGFNRLYDVFGFADWPSELDRWSYYFTHLELVRSWPQSDMYKTLIAWLQKFGEDAHVRTSNADGLFVANGWPEEQTSTPQGQYAFLQCMANCRPDSYWPSLPYLDAARPLMDPATQRLKDESAVPTCQNCGGAMFICVRAASWFNDQPFHTGETRWGNFKSRILASGKKTVILELGAGMNTPGVLRWPNEDIVRESQGSVKLIRVGLGAHSGVQWDLEDEGLATSIDGDIKMALPHMLPSRDGRRAP